MLPAPIAELAKLEFLFRILFILARKIIHPVANRAFHSY